MWIVIDLVIIVLMSALALVHLYRRRASTGRRHRIKWTLLVVLLPFFGAIGYFFAILESSIQRGTPGRRDETAPFLRGFRNDR
jgi:hypothetical protein